MPAADTCTLMCDMTCIEKLFGAIPGIVRACRDSQELGMALYSWTETMQNESNFANHSPHC